MIVVKVGGSLYDLPQLGQQLRSCLACLGDPDWLLVPGGGPAADAIRAYDRDQHLGPVRAHWLALRACTLNAHFLMELLPECRLLADPQQCRGPCILDPFAFAQADEGRPGCLPHCWDATSDSVAARVAQVVGAPLILLKSIDVPANGSLDEAAQHGVVDPVLPRLVAATGLKVRILNLRSL